MRGQDPGSPYVAPPDDIEIGEGETCFLNARRVCAADCVAFNIDEVDEGGGVVQGPTKCTLIVLGGQIASSLSALVQIQKTDRRIKQHANMPDPPTF
jgi:hypothetical protein